MKNTNILPILVNVFNFINTKPRILKVYQTNKIRGGEKYEVDRNKNLTRECKKTLDFVFIFDQDGC